MGKPVDGAAITLWQASGGKEPRQLKTLSSGRDGGFSISLRPKEGAVHYLVATGGRVNGEEAKSLSMLTVLDDKVSGSVVVNELTTVGSIWPNAQCLKATHSTAVPAPWRCLLYTSPSPRDTA